MLIHLREQIDELRRSGRKRGLLAAAISRLEADDPEWRRASEPPQIAAVRSVDRSKYLSAEPLPEWDAED